MEIVIASTNLHKIREIRSILKVYFPFDFLSLLDFPEYKGPEKKESSFEKMAFLKATHAAKALKRWIIADDSGLVVPAFQNQAKSENLEEENKNTNGLENFSIEEETLELFNSEETDNKEKELSSFDANEEKTEEESEFEIPAFLRRQKN